MNAHPFLLAAAICLLCAASTAQVTKRASVDSTGAEPNGRSDAPSISADGRFIAYASGAQNLVPGDANLRWDAFVWNRLTGRTRRVSLGSAGEEGNGDSYTPSLSGDGRYVVFLSDATNLVPGDTNSFTDVFVHDLWTGVTVCASVDPAGAPANGRSTFHASLSADGRFVGFQSDADDLVPGDTNGVLDIFVRDLATGTTRRVSVDSSGVQGNADSYRACLSADGSLVLFESQASNLVPGDTNQQLDVFLHDLQSGTTVRVSLSSSGVQANASSWYPTISADNRWVAFSSWATNLVAGDANNQPDAFVRDLATGTTTAASLDLGGTTGNSESGIAVVSADGRFVEFASFASDLVPADTNGTLDIFVRDRVLGSTTRVSVSSSGAQSNGASGWSGVTMSPDARFVVFESIASNLVEGDTNQNGDIFLHDRTAAGFTSVCEPGANGVQACPCSNSPAGPDRGCDNSSATGGASLLASGAAYISMDSLSFITTGELPSALSVLLQGSSLAANGAVYGQGVRCAGGTLARLYTRTASGGSITVPDIGAGDPTVSARSAARGDVIHPGQSRWYLVYYRDPIVLGGCPAGSSFNATQGGRVEWSL